MCESLEGIEEFLETVAPMINDLHEKKDELMRRLIEIKTIAENDDEYTQKVKNIAALHQLIILKSEELVES